MNSRICICGIGYVGLTLAAVMAEKGFEVTGVDINPNLIKDLNNGQPHFFECGLKEIVKRHLNCRLKFVSEIPSKDFSAFIITVGTPLKPGTHIPNLSSLSAAAESVSHCLSDESLVILRSTVPIGTTRKIVLPILQQEISQVHLAFCPERTVEGKALEEIQTLPQIIGGLNEESTSKAIRIFRQIAPHLIPVSSLESAEMIKLVDNSYRDITFAFANQIADLCSVTNIDALEVIEAGNRNYERNRIPVPGYVGGACLEKDPYLLSYSAKSFSIRPSLVHTARKINETLPVKVAQRLSNLLVHYERNPKTAKVFLSGMAFKGRPGTDDLRGSPSLMLVEALTRLDIKHVVVHDFVVPEKALYSIGLTPVSLEEGFDAADVVIIGNNHNSYQNLNIHLLLAKSHKPVIFFDSWRLYAADSFSMDLGVHYEGIGLRNQLLEADQHG